MPAISFQRQFLDALLHGDKQQTTRKQTNCFKVGDVGHFYIQKREQITDKPLRRQTHEGIDAMYEGGYPRIPELHQAMYHAHFLGKVEITEVYDIHPCELRSEELEAWAMADGFESFHPPHTLYTKGIRTDYGANTWFMRRYGDDWMQRTWTVVRWDGWMERYFEPEP